MPTINRQLFADAPVLRVRGVTLSGTDDLETHRAKLARIVLDGMFEFTGLLDAQGRIVEISRSALEGAGVVLDDVQGKLFWEAHWWDVSDHVRERLKEAIGRAQQGEFVRCDFENYGRDAGREVAVVDFSLCPIVDDRGRLVLLLAEGRDITEKKRAEVEIATKNEELAALLDRVRQLDAMKNRFFANLSHELRTPLALILGPAGSMLADAQNLTVAQRRDLAVIHRNAATLLKHVNDLLDLAKLEARRVELEYARFDLAHAVRSIAAHFEALASERLLDYEIATPERLESEADAEKIDRVLLNLLSNAFKFTPAGGRIRCALAALGEDRVVLSVEDSGPGVAPELREAIFDRFSQGQRGTIDEFGGTGLGLAIAKEFVDLHHGTIGVGEAPGGGALFRVELPRRAPAGVYVRSAGPAPTDGGSVGAAASLAELQRLQTTREPVPAAHREGLPLVVVAEDNADMRRYIAELLATDYRVVPVADGAAALACAMAEPPHLVVTDLMMPRLGGDELVREMRARPSLAHVPVLMLSASADESLRLKLLAETVQDYVTKPFSPPELRARVRNLVTVKQVRDALQKELASQNADLSQLAGQLIASKHSLQRSLKARKLAEEKVRHLAYFDATTELPNRVQLREILQRAVSEARDRSQPVALLMLSVDRLREIAYTLGQADGDALLRQIGPRIRASLRAADALAYCGDRNFAMVCPGLGAQAACELADRVARSFEQPFEIAALTIEIGANVGIAIFPGHGEDADVLMRHGEVALYRAQQEGRGQVLYSAERDLYNPRRLQLIGELRAAIGRHELVLYCQPKLDLKTREIVALEGLVRWQHPSFGLISPDAFVPLVERTGLIAPLTQWVLDAALVVGHAWEQKKARVPIAINLSAHTLADPKLVDDVRNAMITWGAEAHWIDLEITESAIMVDPHAALTTLDQLNRMGFRIVVDDFGTGYSSLAYLRRLPVEALKIDKSFVLPMLEDADALAIVRSTIELGHNLGLRVIAEGVENQEICECLASLGCDEAQGYCIGAPMPAERFGAWLAEAPWPLASARR